MDALRLLLAYLEELHARLPEGAHDLEATWSKDEYGGPRGRVFVARIDGVPVGCAGLREHARGDGEMKRLYIEPLSRRRGAARALLGAVERAARELGYRRIVLDTASPLVEAAHLYENSGYAAIAPFNDNRHATCWLAKMLPLDDEALWGAFRHLTLSHAEWSHESHVRTAFLHLARWDLDESHLRMRAGIIRLNASHGVEESPARGFHETLTRAWLAIIADARSRHRAATSDALLAAQPELLHRELALRFYTRERLFSLRARSVFVDPDVAPLPGE
jgi:GNAT superfamily N-acetyltransferase